MDITQGGYDTNGTVTVDLDRQLADLGSSLYAPVEPGQRSCCCLAAPAVRVLLPATAGRNHPVDLLLCNHHYRRSTRALAARGAYVFDVSGVLVAGPTG